MSSDLESIHSLRPVSNALPGEPVPYHLAFGEGARFELDGQLWTLIARGSDTGGLLDAAYVFGPKGSRSPFQVHSSAQRSFTVMDGSAQFWLGTESRVLVPGDFVHVPPGTPVAYRFLAHNTRLLTWGSPGGVLDYVERVGESVDRHTYSHQPKEADPTTRREAAAAVGITFPTLDEVEATEAADAVLPAGAEPYFLRSGEGDRYHMGQLFTYLTRGRNTDNQYFAIHNEGGPSDYLIRHFHERHTETFLALAGRVWLHVNGEEVLLTRGDFVHAPAGTIHSFAFDAHNTRMLGVLTPNVFEPFFETLGADTEDYVYQESTDFVAPPPPPPALQAELDVVVVGPPPERKAGADILLR